MACCHSSQSDYSRPKDVILFWPKFTTILSVCGRISLGPSWHFFETFVTQCLWLDEHVAEYYFMPPHFSCDLRPQSNVKTHVCVFWGHSLDKAL